MRRFNLFPLIVAIFVAALWSVAPTRAVAQENPPTTKWSLTLAARAPNWTVATTAAYDIDKIEEVLGQKNWTLYLVGLGGAEVSTGSPTGGFGLIARPRVAKNVYLDVGITGVMGDKNRLYPGWVISIRALTW